MNLVYKLFFILLFCPLVSFAQTERSASFKEKYQLKEVVVLSRHNIRSPLSKPGSVLGKMTPHQWTEWSANTSELTLRGGVLETMMGQFFRKWLVAEGLFPENHAPSADEIHVYANSMQRTIATAQYFTSGFMPVANLTIQHRMAPSKMDPVFCPQLTKASDKFEKQALKQIEEMYGNKGLEAITDSLQVAYATLAKVLDFKQSPAYQSGAVRAFHRHDLQLFFQRGKEPGMKGGLKTATSASDALILQYYEEPDAVKAAFGHHVTSEDWEQIACIKDVYGDVLFTAPIVAYNVAHPLLVYLNEELNISDRKFTFLCGHDSNIASVNAALEVENYELPHSIEKKTPIGCKLVFEKWIDKEGNEFMAVNLVYQSTEQLRNLQLLDVKNPPMVYPLTLKNLSTNTDGLYTFEDVRARFEKAIAAYDEIN